MDADILGGSVLTMSTAYFKNVSGAFWNTYANWYTTASCTKTPTATMTIANPAVVTITAHKFANGDAVVFTTTGALPTGVASGTTYYARSVTSDTFNLYDTSANAVSGGTTGRVTTTGSQSGVHTCTGPSRLGGVPWASGGSFNDYDLAYATGVTVQVSSNGNLGVSGNAWTNTGTCSLKLLIQANVYSGNFSNDFTISTFNGATVIGNFSGSVTISQFPVYSVVNLGLTTGTGSVFTGYLQLMSGKYYGYFTSINTYFSGGTISNGYLSGSTHLGGGVFLGGKITDSISGSGTSIRGGVITVTGWTTWTGASDGDLGNSGNWSNGLPSSGVNVMLNTAGNMPTAGSCSGNVILGFGATLSSGGTYTGSFNNYGTIDSGDYSTVSSLTNNGTINGGTFSYNTFAGGSTGSGSFYWYLGSTPTTLTSTGYGVWAGQVYQAGVASSTWSFPTAAGVFYWANISGSGAWKDQLNWVLNSSGTPTQASVIPWIYGDGSEAEDVKLAAGELWVPTIGTGVYLGGALGWYGLFSVSGTCDIAGVINNGLATLRETGSLITVRLFRQLFQEMGSLITRKSIAEPFLEGLP